MLNGAYFAKREARFGPEQKSERGFQNIRRSFLEYIWKSVLRIVATLASGIRPAGKEITFFNGSSIGIISMVFSKMASRLVLVGLSIHLGQWSLESVRADLRFFQ